MNVVGTIGLATITAMVTLVLPWLLWQPYEYVELQWQR